MINDSKTSKLSSLDFWINRAQLRGREEEKKRVKKTTKLVCVESLLQKEKRKERKGGRGERPLYHG
jgi:hypothetical protein